MIRCPNAHANQEEDEEEINNTEEEREDKIMFYCLSRNIYKANISISKLFSKL